MQHLIKVFKPEGHGLFCAGSATESKEHISSSTPPELAAYLDVAHGQSHTHDGG
jgi:hypothetical protein